MGVIRDIIAPINSTRPRPMSQPHGRDHYNTQSNLFSPEQDESSKAPVCYCFPVFRLTDEGIFLDLHF